MPATNLRHALGLHLHQRWGNRKLPIKSRTGPADRDLAQAEGDLRLSRKGP